MNTPNSTPKKLLIIGCGDIGERLAASLPATEFEITGLRRTAMNNPESPIHYRVCNVFDQAALDNIIAEGFDIIVITMTPTERSDHGYELAYVQTNRYVIESLTRHNLQPELIVFASSTGVYAQHDGSCVDEHSPTQPDHYRGLRLLEAENVLRSSNFDHTIVRFSGIYGPGRLRLIEQVERGRAALSASYTNRIHADDAAGVIAHLINKRCSNEVIEPIYIATDSAPVPMAEVVAWLSMQLKTNTAVFAPDDAEHMAGNKRCSNQRLLNSGYVFKYPDFRAGYTSVLKSLGFGFN